MNQGNNRSSEAFGVVFRQISVLFSLLILLELIAGVPRNAPSRERFLHGTFFWGAGFSFIVLIALGLAFYVNPHARFSTNRFPAITPAARSIKTTLYSQLISPPDIVIFGSSRAFTLSPRYIEQKSGHQAFNMSVEGGRAGDYLVQINYILKSRMIPRVLIVDVSRETFATEYFNSDLQPLGLIPYMPPRMALQVIGKSLQDVLSLQSISDAIYLLSHPGVEDRRTWTFDHTGLGMRKPLTYNQYLRILRSTISQRAKSLHCHNLNPIAQNTFEDFIALSRKNGIGVVLYVSPLHAEFYEFSYNKNPKRFEACRRLLGDYLMSLSDTYPNVYFRDLSDYKLISDMKEDGFYDAVHLRQNAADLVIDALMPEIEDAMQWSLQAMKN